MRIRTTDGLVLAGTAAEVVAQLREAAHLPILTDAEYMHDVGQRISLWNGETVRTSDPTAFLDDLMRAGVLTIIEA